MPELWERGEGGYPILLSNVASTGVAKTDPNTTSGNPNHDVRSGKFGAGSKAASGKTAKANQDTEAQAALRRRQDAVRDASRSLDDITSDTAKEFLEDRVSNVDEVDIDSFITSVKAQRLDDVADALYSNFTKAGLGVKIVSDKGWLKSALNGLDASQVQDVFRRLVSRGIDAGTLAKKVVPSITDVNLRESMKSEFGG